jgi:amino acid adenylation domain-containing protein
LPFEKLVEELQPERNLSHNPLFQVMFALQNVPTMGNGPSQSYLEYQDSLKQISTDKAKFDLSLFMMEKEWGLGGEIEYNLDMFDASTIDRLIGHFQQLLRGVVSNPEQRLSELPLLTEAERQQLLVEWNHTETDFKSESVPQLFEDQVERTPEAVAVVFEDEELSYRELNRRANQVAHYLGRRGIGPEVRVGICMERSLELVVGILGILKAGAAYVPLDPGYPRERLAYILDDAQVRVLLTQKHLSGMLSPHPTEVVCLDLEWDAIAREADQRPEIAVNPHNLAYVIYTSGSTGSPKGVAMHNRPLANLIQWQINTWAPTCGLRTLQFAAFGFDVSFQEVFSTWCSGGVLVVIPDKLREDPEELLNYLIETRVERVFLPPVALRQLAEVSVSRGTIPTSIREIITAGEQLKVTETIAQFLMKIGDCILRNQYGPTESHVVTEQSLKGHPQSWLAQPPIGTPIANARIYVLDAHLQPVPIGVSGTLHIGGLGLARGYLNHPELTAEKFIPDPFSEEVGSRIYNSGDIARFLTDGRIEFLGRADDQVKIRGFRVEPGEVEALLEQHPGVKEAVVTAMENAIGDKQLVAYVVRDPQLAPSISHLIRFMRERVPDYLIPSALVDLDSLPLSPNGKVDRRALPMPEGARPQLEKSFVAPRTPIEETIAGIWQKILGLKTVGVEDNFFDLGGHSLLATQVISRIRSAFQVESLSLRRLFETPTIADLASAVIEIQLEN